MRNWKMMVPSALLAAALVTTCVMVAGVSAAPKAKPLTIKEVMGKFHKGKPPVCEKAAKGEASETELKELLAAYEGMAKQKPKKGDADSWKTKCEALVNATKDLIAKKDGASAAFQEALNCKACHSVHK